VLWVGRTAPGPWEELAAGYARRLSRMATFTQVRVRPATGRAGDPHRALAEEAGRIRAHLKPGDLLVTVDERGVQRTTEELAGWLQESLGRRRVVLVVGSDLGLDPALRREARESLALSRLTLAHQLARVLVLEQLYRCLDLLGGGAYHRGGNIRPGPEV
jgi:23S rRNA (pseudouridine1915-N3)-methyltransferase